MVRAGELTADISGSLDPFPARRFSVTVAEEALQRMVPEAVRYVAEQLAEQVVYEQHGAVQTAVHSYLTDRAWAEPIIRDAIRQAVREYVLDMLKTERQ